MGSQAYAYAFETIDFWPFDLKIQSEDLQKSTKIDCKFGEIPQAVYKISGSKTSGTHAQTAEEQEIKRRQQL